MTTMLERLALVIYWAACWAAAAFVAIAIGVYGSSIAMPAVLCDLAVLVWITGQAVQFIVFGR
jgi:hypothetical protein